MNNIISRWYTSSFSECEERQLRKIVGKMHLNVSPSNSNVAVDRPICLHLLLFCQHFVLWFLLLTNFFFVNDKLNWPLSQFKYVNYVAYCAKLQCPAHGVHGKLKYSIFALHIIIIQSFDCIVVLHKQIFYISRFIFLI